MNSKFDSILYAIKLLWYLFTFSVMNIQCKCP